MSFLPYITETLPGTGGTLRVEPEDFVVEEIRAFAASGEGEHLLLWIEKRNTSHDYLMQHLAERLGVPRRAIGTAGIKDRRAVTRQAVSVPAAAQSRIADVETELIHVIEAQRHRHKLRAGHLKGNQFSVLLRGVDTEGYQAAVGIHREIAQTGIPNFFGPQRFGRGCETLQQGLQLITGQRRAEQLPRKRREFLLRLSLSAVQSELFNQVLASRIHDGLGRTVLIGDVMQVVLSGGPFYVEDACREQARFEERETVIAGPIFGPKMLASRGVPNEREQQVMAANGLDDQHFERFRRLTRGTRRANWVYPGDFQFSAEPDGLRLEFSLQAGSYATVVLREFMKTEALAETE